MTEPTAIPGLDELQALVDQSRAIVFFGGAGVSTESGVPDFRSQDGLYHQSWRWPPETILSHTFFVHHTADFPQRIGVCGLHADFKLYQTGTHLCHQCNLILPENISRNLKMEVSDTIVMVIQILPDSHGMVVIAVKGPVYKFNLLYLFLQEKSKLLLYHLNIPETHGFING